MADPMMTAGLVSGGLGVLGGVMGSMGQSAGIEAQIEGQRRAREQQLEDLRGIYEPASEQLQGLYAPFSSLAQTGAERIQGDFGIDRPDFQYGGQVEDFLDPSIDFQVQQATGAIQSGAAAQGSLLSGAAQKAIADRAQQIGQTGYASAFDRMQQDRSFQAQEAQQRYGADLTERGFQYGQGQDILQTGLGALGGQARGIEFGAAGIGGALQQLGPAPSAAGLGSLASGQALQGLGSGLLNFGGQLLNTSAGQRK